MSRTPSNTPLRYPTPGGLSPALGATLAWGGGKMTGRRQRAATMGLAAVVTTQLGQTLLASRSPVVLVTSAASAAALVLVVNTPGISQFFGCTPLGPVGWVIVTASSAAATAAAMAARLLPPRAAASSSAASGGQGGIAAGKQRTEVAGMPGREELPSTLKRSPEGGRTGPSDEQCASPPGTSDESFGGVDANASKNQLLRAPPGSVPGVVTVTRTAIAVPPTGGHTCRRVG